MTKTFWTALLLGTITVTGLAACGDDDDMAAAGSAGTAGTDTSGTSGTSGASGAAGASGTAGTAGASGTGGGASQTPPTGKDNIVPWLATGDYKQWHCESAVHAARSPSPHGFNRICSNDVIAGAADSTGEWPEGAAAVKELYAAESDATPMGYAVYLKTKATSDAGASWYWYEDNPEINPAGGVVADGMGDMGNPKTICVGCHSAVATDAAHTPTMGGHDFVYTPVHLGCHNLPSCHSPCFAALGPVLLGALGACHQTLA